MITCFFRINLIRQKWLKVGFGLLWLALGLSFLVIGWKSEIPPGEVPKLLADWIQSFGYVPAVALFLILYTLRPLVLFPSTVMGVASGMTFGPIVGSLVTLVGELSGAALAYSGARLVGRRWVQGREWPKFARWDRMLSQNGLMTICIMRLISLPFDTVSYACGLSSVRFRDFLLGTLLGSFFYVLSVTLLGGSASVGLEGDVSLFGMQMSRRMLVLISSGASFALGVTIAWSLRHRYRDPQSES